MRGTVHCRAELKDWSSREARDWGTAGKEVGEVSGESRVFLLVSEEQTRLQVIKLPPCQPLPLPLESAAWHVPASVMGPITDGKWLWGAGADQPSCVCVLQHRGWGDVPHRLEAPVLLDRHLGGMERLQGEELMAKAELWGEFCPRQPLCL